MRLNSGKTYQFINPYSTLGDCRKALTAEELLRLVPGVIGLPTGETKYCCAPIAELEGCSGDSNVTGVIGANKRAQAATRNGFEKFEEIKHGLEKE